MENRIKDTTAELIRAYPEIVFTDSENLYLYSFDSLKISFLPDAVIKPTSHQQIGEILIIANKSKIPVTVRGTGTTLTGGSTPIKGGWVIDLTALNSITIDPTNRMAHVEAGAVVKDIQDQAESHGLYYPPDPSSYKWCTIGGNIACNAGGLRCVKYGVTRDYILSLKGYLPTGEYVEWARPVRKFATGFNIRDLWIGSEGMLGVVTSATLKLIPRPQNKITILLGFDSEKNALNEILKLLELGITPSIIEFIDSLSVKGAESVLGKPFFANLTHPPVLLLELDGSTNEIETDLKIVEKWAKEATSHIKYAKSEEASEELWEVRRKCSGAMFKLGDSKLNEDIVVPLSAMPKLIETVANLRNDYQIPIAVFGHAGDGNLHVNIMYNREDSSMCKRAQNALYLLMEQVVELNGAISGEHGVGLAKSHFINLQFNSTQIELMKKIKKTFDPNGILNPGKFFEEFSPWQYKKVVHQFPWDKKK